LALKNNFNQHRATFPLTTTPPPWFYEFNRSYQSTGYDPNAPVCDAPRDASYTNGNPESEYYKCHPSELYFTFGNVFRQQLPDREGLDGSFARLMVDQWTAFARTCNPNPDIGILLSKGYWNTVAEVRKAGKWDQVTAANLTRISCIPLFSESHLQHTNYHGSFAE
jgi:carboxylesterase type B